MKTCITCNIEKNLSEFSITKNKCKECCAKYNKIIYENTKKKVIDTTKTKICNVCDIEKNLSEFNINRSKCKKCFSHEKRLHINNNKNAFLGKLLSSAKKSAKSRKELASEFNITIDDLINLTVKQDNKCYYSGIELSYEMYTDYQCSLERLNPLLGYITTNIALICLEFQSASQWKPEKYQEFMSLLFNNHEKQIVNFYPLPKIYTQNEIKYEIIDGTKYITCNKCKIAKTVNKFNKNISGGCKECISKSYKLYMETPKGHLMKLLNSMRSNSKTRKHEPPKITLQDLIDLFELQNGLCKYTNIPLTFGSYREKNWTCSVERKNSLLGYTKENVILICFEFNTMDNVSRAISPENMKGSSQWSNKKVEFIKNKIITKELEN